MNIKPSEYHPNWQQSRIDFIISKYPKSFFNGKTILELAPYNGYIGAYFQSLGASVHCIEGRKKNVDRILEDYPNLSVDLYDLDTPIWKWGNYDIIINFGLFYHLEKFHIQHMENCIANCNLMFFESVIYDSFEEELFLNEEYGDDQSISNIGKYPSTSFIEKIFDTKNCSYKKYTDSILNTDYHKYDWEDMNLKILQSNRHARRFWIINTNRKPQ